MIAIDSIKVIYCCISSIWLYSIFRKQEIPYIFNYKQEIPYIFNYILGIPVILSWMYNYNNSTLNN